MLSYNILHFITMSYTEKTNFSQSNDPYKFLGVRYGASIEELRSQFKKRALQVHPDKGGSAKDFIKLKSAYKYLFGYITKQQSELKKTSVPVKHLRKQELNTRKQFDQELSHQTQQNPFVENNAAEGDFNDKFNTLFEANKLEDAFSRGYDVERQSVSGKQLDAEDLMRGSVPQEKRQLAVYKEPEPVDVSGDYYQYGVDKVNDFSDSSASKKFSDYMDAFTDRQPIETMENCRSDYKSVNDYKQARTSSMRNLDQDEGYYTMKQEEEQVAEEMRRYRLAEYDKIANKNFNNVNRQIQYLKR